MDTERPSPSPDERTTRSRWISAIWPFTSPLLFARTFLIAAATAGGAYGLVRLAYHVTSAPPQTNDGLIQQQYARSVWLHPVFLELARRPSELAECQSCESYRRFADARHLQNAWYLITIKGLQINGETVTLPTIRRPVGEMVLWLGWVILYGSRVVLLVMVVLTVVIILVVPWEERILARQFGETYRQFQARVPRWLWRTRRQSTPAPK